MEGPDRQPWDKLQLTELSVEKIPFMVKFHLRLGALTWIALAHYEENRNMHDPPLPGTRLDIIQMGSNPMNEAKIYQDEICSLESHCLVFIMRLSS